MAKPSKKTEKTKDVDVSMNDNLGRIMAENKMAGMWDFADAYTDMNVVVQSTGFPQWDMASHPEYLGIPKGRHIEIFSVDPSAGKTSGGLAFVKAVQSAGGRTAIAEPEGSLTNDYYKANGVITDPAEADKAGVYAVRIMRAKTKLDRADEFSKVLRVAEEYLDQIGYGSEVFDLVLIDSVDALVRRADLLKDASTNKGVGGISQLMSQYMRSATTKRATCAWLNQSRCKVGGFSPSGGQQYVTTGGKALPFYSTQRWQFTNIGRLSEGEKNPPYGFTAQIFSQKNKVAPQWRSCNLTYIFGEGFSQAYDYFDLAIQQGIIEKTEKGGWHTFGGGGSKPALKLQGKMNFYRRMKADPDLFKEIKALVDAEEVMPEVVESTPTINLVEE